MDIVLTLEQQGEATFIKNSYDNIIVTVGTDIQALQSNKNLLNEKIVVLNKLREATPKEPAAIQAMYDEIQLLQNTIESQTTTLEPNLTLLNQLSTRSLNLINQIKFNYDKSTDQDIITAIGTVIPRLFSTIENLLFTGVDVGSSSTQFFNVNGSNLAGNIVVRVIQTTPGVFTVSIDDVDYLNQITLIPNEFGVVPSTKIFVKFRPVAPTPYHDKITISSTNATSLNVLLNSEL